MIYLDKFLKHLSVVEEKSERTIKEYNNDINMLFKFLTEVKQKNNTDKKEFLNSITLDNIYEFLEYLKDNRKNTANTRRRKIASLKSFFDYLYKFNIVNCDITTNLESPKVPQRTPIYLTLDECKRLLNCVKNSMNNISFKNDSAIRDYCILTLFLNCGLRLSELCSIDIQDIRNNKLTIIGKGDKQREMYLNNACTEAINSYLSIRNGIVITNEKDKNALFISRKGNRLCTRAVERMVKKYIKEIGLDETKYSVHKLRHTAATLVYSSTKNIVAVQQMLGHSNVSTTQIYAHISNNTMKNAMASNPLNF